MPKQRLPFECVALLLQGGGALGAYQAGVYEAMAKADIEPDWVAGISIGAINAAIIAGNRPEDRVKKLRQFWENVTIPAGWVTPMDIGMQMWNNSLRSFVNQMSAGTALMNGVPNFFTPRIPSPWLHEKGSLEATSYYDTSKLKPTLEAVIDFDLLNNQDIRFSCGAVEVTSGNLACFDSKEIKIRVEHIMASAALPPGFPAVEIDGAYYWDGGLVSNTPLQWVMETRPRVDTLAFQVDLWSADGDFPRDMAEVMTRQKEIQYSSRTRANTDRFKTVQKIHYALAKLMEEIPDAMKNSEEVQLLAPYADRKICNIAHLIYHTRAFEGDSKDYEFSRSSMEDHWKAGMADTEKTLSHPEVLQRPANPEGLQIFDFSRGEGQKSNQSKKTKGLK